VFPADDRTGCLLRLPTCDIYCLVPALRTASIAFSFVGHNFFPEISRRSGDAGF